MAANELSETSPFAGTVDSGAGLGGSTVFDGARSSPSSSDEDEFFGGRLFAAESEADEFEVDESTGGVEGSRVGVSDGTIVPLVVDVSIGEAPFSRSAQAENTNCAVINMAATRRVDVTINETLQNLVCNGR